VRLDGAADDQIKKARLHRKVTTSIFFESNGGILRAESTIPEIRLAVAEPALDIGNVETVLETLATDCYYLSIEKNKYRFSLSPNLNKILADRRANVQSSRITETETITTENPNHNKGDYIQISKTVAEKNTPYDSNTKKLPDPPEAIKKSEIITLVESAKLLKWSGEIIPQRWMNFYTKVLSKFASDKDVKLTLKVEVLVEGEIATQKIEETKVALSELGLNNNVRTDI
jgi:hypothetical protein